MLQVHTAAPSEQVACMLFDDCETGFVLTQAQRQ